MEKTDLIIIGAGAAGLMAGVAAGELGLKTLLLERKHKPGRKLLMCGNARCNLTTNISKERMIQMLGEPVADFLTPALLAFSPADLQRWFAANGLRTIVKTGNKVYPHTERASDVLTLFSDLLREKKVSLATSAPVELVEKRADGFLIKTRNFSVESRYLLIATGGISYPKTGSVGDGQKWAETLGHSLEPYRPGLVGFEVDSAVLNNRVGELYEKVRVEVFHKNRLIGETRGVFEIEKWGIGGTAITDASRLISRQQISSPILHIYFDNGTHETIRPLRTRPIKEAMVTIGGVSRKEINPRTMQSNLCPKLYFAGEVMDVDGPTGGYNLQAAFATARLSIAHIGEQCGKGSFVPIEKKRPHGKDLKRGKTQNKTAPVRKKRTHKKRRQK